MDILKNIAYQILHQNDKKALKKLFLLYFSAEDFWKKLCLTRSLTRNKKRASLEEKVPNITRDCAEDMCLNCEGSSETFEDLSQILSLP